MSHRVGTRVVASLPWVALFGVALLGPSLEAQVSVLPEDTSNQEASATDRHAVAEGETLSLLAGRYLNDADAWPKLWSFNPEITNPHWIYPGLVLRLREGVDLSASPVAAPPPQSGTAAAGTRLTFGRRVGAGPAIVRLGEEVYLDGQALAQAARIVGSREEHFMLSPTDEVYLQFKAQNSEPSPGKELTVFIRNHRAELSHHAGKLRTYHAYDGGEVVRVLGALKIKSYDRERRIARAVVTEAIDAIERGFEVADVPPRLVAVAPRKNARELKAKILASTRALGTLGDGQLVFLNAGSKQGVEVGNSFVVVRQGDPWRQRLSLREELSGAERPDRHPPAASALPPEVVGELRVLYVRPDTATALITSSLVELSPGEQVEMRTEI